MHLDHILSCASVSLLDETDLMTFRGKDDNIFVDKYFS